LTAHDGEHCSENEVAAPHRCHGRWLAGAVMIFVAGRTLAVAVQSSSRCSPPSPTLDSHHWRKPSTDVGASKSQSCFGGQIREVNSPLDWSIRRHERARGTARAARKRRKCGYCRTQTDLCNWKLQQALLPAGHSDGTRRASMCSYH